MNDSSDSNQPESAGAHPGTDDGDASPRVGPVRVAAAIAAVLLLAFFVVLATRDSEGGATADSPLIGELVPQVQGTTFAGETFDIDEHRNQWIIVNFFASWCVPCEREHPELVALSEQWEGTAMVVSIPFGDTEADARAFFEEHGGDWPVVLDPRAEAAVSFGVLRPPETYLVARGGTVVAKWIGDIRAEQVSDVIQSYIDATVSENPTS